MNDQPSRFTRALSAAVGVVFALQLAVLGLFAHDARSAGPTSRRLGYGAQVVIPGGSANSGSVTSPTDADLSLTPGVYSSSPATKRNTLVAVGDGNASHSNQTGALVMEGTTGILVDSHGIGHDSGDEHVNQWKHIYAGVDEGAPYDLAVETSYAGSWTNTSRGAAYWQTTFQSSSPIGARFYDTSNSRSAFQTTSNGSSFGSTVDANQGGAVQFPTTAWSSAPGAGLGWFGFDGTSFIGRNNAGDSMQMLRLSGGNYLFPAGVNIASTQASSGVGAASSWYGQQSAAGNAGPNTTIGGGKGGTSGTNKAGGVIVDLGTTVSGASASFSLIADGSTLVGISQSSAGAMTIQGGATNIAMNTTGTLSFQSTGAQYYNFVGPQGYLDSDTLNSRSKNGSHTNLSVGTPTSGQGGGVGTMFIGECTTIPPNTPTLGCQIYVDPADHKLKAKCASGTVTTLALP